MTKRNPFLYIDDILESIHLINEYTRDISKEGFLNDAKLQDAVFRRMEIIGEAAKNLPEEFQEKSPHIPGRQIASPRDVICLHGICGYFSWNSSGRFLAAS